MPRCDVFFSYSFHDLHVCEPIVRSLQNSGLNVWFDTDKIDDEIGLSISEGLAEAKILIIYITKNSINSEWVKSEFQAFQNVPWGDAKVHRRHNIFYYESTSKYKELKEAVKSLLGYSLAQHNNIPIFHFYRPVLNKNAILAEKITKLVGEDVSYIPDYNLTNDELANFVQLYWVSITGSSISVEQAVNIVDKFSSLKGPYKFLSKENQCYDQQIYDLLELCSTSGAPRATFNRHSARSHSIILPDMFHEKSLFQVVSYGHPVIGLINLGYESNIMDELLYSYYLIRSRLHSSARIILLDVSVIIVSQHVLSRWLGGYNIDELVEILVSQNGY